jgi:two-component system, chemotaxis family, response regulator WspF
MMRIALVNDVPMAVEALRRVVTSVPDYQIAWIATDGEEAVRMCAADVPDLILMDLMMPRMDGAEASRIIMRDSPCAILIVTATVGGHSSKVFEAMGWGALDAVNTPVFDKPGEPARPSDLLAKIAMLRKLIGKSPPLNPPLRVANAASSDAGPGFPLIAIGASTGGPAALARVLAALPQPFPAAITIVQHVDELFAQGLASWLGRESSRDVRVIRANDRPEPSIVQIASTNGHLLLTPALTFTYSEEPVDYAYRPSVDVFFHTVARFWPVNAVGVLLTGMGADGAQGLLAMRRAGWHTIAQDQASSIVYGMPKAAAKIDAAMEILPLDQIAGAISRAASVPAARQRIRKRGIP